MRNVILTFVDFACYAGVIASTLFGAAAGYVGAFDNVDGALLHGVAGLLVGGFLGFASSALLAGSLLALTETARNTRRILELMERRAAGQ
jgi:hypothetical protein